MTGKKKLILGLKLLFGIACLAIVLYYVDLGATVSLFTNIGMGSLAALYAIYMADRVLMAYKWGLLLWKNGVTIGLWPLVKAYCYSAFAGTVLPASVGSDVVRFLTVAREPIEQRILVASMVVEKLLAFLAIAAMAATGIVLLYALSNAHDKAAVLLEGVVWFAAFAMGGMLGVWLILSRVKSIGSWVPRFASPLLPKLLSVVDALITFAGQRRLLLVFFALSLLEQLVAVAGVYVVAKSMAIPISVLHTFCIVSIALLLARIPITISGLGVQEGIYVALFALVGLSAEQGLALSIGARIMDIVLPLPIATIYFSETVRSIKQARLKGGDAPAASYAEAKRVGPEN